MIYGRAMFLRNNFGGNTTQSSRRIPRLRCRATGQVPRCMPPRLLKACLPCRSWVKKSSKFQVPNPRVGGTQKIVGLQTRSWWWESIMSCWWSTFQLVVLTNLLYPVCTPGTSKYWEQKMMKEPLCYKMWLLGILQMLFGLTNYMFPLYNLTRSLS